MFGAIYFHFELLPYEGNVLLTNSSKSFKQQAPTYNLFY